MAERDLTYEEKRAVLEEMQSIRGQAEKRNLELIARSERLLQVFLSPNQSPVERPIFLQKLGECATFVVKRLSIQKGQTLTHWSPKQIFLFCLKGQAEFSNKETGQVYLIQEGTSICVDPKLKFSIHCLSDSTFLMQLFTERTKLSANET